MANMFAQAEALALASPPSRSARRARPTGSSPSWGFEATADHTLLADRLTPATLGKLVALTSTAC